ncbi:MAG: L-histidine N(alpha)-methyltransferase [Betaproteobacteria bacterium]|nr:L-histidine N(alpha)-methyltransferase [Betaproteobacteria bacterium]
MENPPSERVAFQDLQPHGGEAFGRAVLGGLALPHKALPAKFFYDQRGSALFEQICQLPEYYPTRTEMGILARCLPEMIPLLGERCVLIEYGSGNSEKTRLLLQSVRPLAYLPVDISHEQLRDACASLHRDYPWLTIEALCADYTGAFELPGWALDVELRRSIFFPGSTIGNFTPEEAVPFLERAARLVGRGGVMLVGVDLKKDARILNLAYDDPAGVTAAFNLNVLERINRELEGDFDCRTFRHRAFYNEALGRVEMHLVSTRAQVVHVMGVSFRFEEGESIHTENSYKYTATEFQALADRAGFDSQAVWTDEARRFSVHCLVSR